MPEDKSARLTLTVSALQLTLPNISPEALKISTVNGCLLPFLSGKTHIMDDGSRHWS
jgi:hypothetical protein